MVWATVAWVLALAPSEERVVSHGEPPPNAAANTPLAVLPGILIPGLGHSLNGEAETASRLRLVSGAGAASALLGGGILFLSGGSDKLAPAAFPLLFAGGGVFAVSWLADILGTARPLGWGERLGPDEGFTASIQYGLSRDPYTPVRHLVLSRVGWEARRWLLDGRATLGPGTGYLGLLASAGPKLWTGPPGHLAFLLEGGRGKSGTSGTTADQLAGVIELRVEGGAIGPSLRGLRLIERLGAGAIRYRFEGTLPAASQAMLLIETGLCLAATDDLELSLFHRKRPDLRLGEMSSQGGSFELAVKARLSPRLRLFGSSHLGTGADALLGLEAAW